MYENLEELANLKIGKAIERLSRENSERMSGIVRNHTQRGLSQSGLLEGAKVRSQLQTARELCEEVYKIWLDLILAADKALTEQSVAFIVRKVQDISISQAGNIRKNFNKILSPQGEAELAAQVDREMTGVVGSVRRDLEILRRERGLASSKTTPEAPHVALFDKVLSAVFGAKLHQMPADNRAAPPSVLKQAINAVPAVKYALGVGGIVAVIAIVRGFGIDFRVALWGTVVMLVLMTVLLVFAKASSRPQSAFKGPAFILTWFSIVLFMATAAALFFSVFFGKPLDLRTLLAPVHAGQMPVEKHGTAEVLPPETDRVDVIVKRVPTQEVTAKVGHPGATPSTSPAAEADVHEQLVSGRLTQGWTLHKRGNAWTISFIVDTGQLNAALRAAINGTDVNIEPELATKANALWSEIRAQVPAPKPAETEYGIVKGQEFVEHVVHYLTRRPDALEWTYEIMLAGSGITPQPQVSKQISVSSLSPGSRETISELDALAAHTVNRRYVDAMVRISK